MPVAVCAVNTADQGAEAAAAYLHAHEAVDALAAMSDELAVGALLAAREVGVSVPDQLAVTGWDDTAAAAPAGLTTVRQDLREQGARCARIALGETDWSPADRREQWTIGGAAAHGDDAERDPLLSREVPRSEPSGEVKSFR